MEKFHEWRAIAKENGIYDGLYRSRVRQGWDMEDAATLPKGAKNPNLIKCERDVAIYKGDQFIVWGKVSEVAVTLNKTNREIKQLCTQSIRKRAEGRGNELYGIYIEDDEEVVG
ncbi:hypothetical protein F9U64_01275 [Gracilibacillus oryzae]|uniref:Uncharacterized protein n=1 Tax=Gracilibacillus oryzae TaxID=1672701 RepID=A0A7C8L9V0_9BACI|nr:hypothetical protein [Gracilibacillus oryzae]KAB8139284.1 hypothetical protein F9U64_01275 [Gracilibacillus oryzae]